MSKFVVEFNDRQSAMDVDINRLEKSVEQILEDSDFSSAEISVAIVGDSEMHELNRQYLDHDYPTDVLSFVLIDQGDRLEGEIIVSTETAISQAVDHQIHPADELLLYVIHGMLHLVGYDDKQDDRRVEMRKMEARYMKQAGVPGFNSAENAE